MIELIKYIILGIVQGIAEPIPISSSGHLVIFQTILEKLTSGPKIDYETLATLTNFGSFIAIVIFFFPEIKRLVISFFSYIFSKKERKSKQDDFNYCIKIIVATIPAGIVGVIATHYGLLDFLSSNVKFIGLMLILTAFLLYLIKDIKGTKNIEHISFKDAIIVGIFQMIALVPGISRSGATIVGGMKMDFKRETAFNFAFMLYLPVSFGTTILGFKDLFGVAMSNTQMLYYLVATMFAFIFTFITIKWFSKIMKEGKLIYFSIYCLIVGTLVALFL